MSEKFNTKAIPDRDIILDEVSELAIFRHYLGDVEINEYICNPMRTDNSPTAMIYENEYGRLKFRDYSGYFWGDCFDLVMRMEKGVNTFQEAMAVIWEKHQRGELENRRITSVKRYKRVNNIYVKIRAWNQHDIEFWEGKYSITPQTLAKFNVYPLELIWFNHTYDSNVVYKYMNQYDPAYGYYSGKNRWEIYYPSREKHRKFQTNHGLTKGIVEFPQYADIAFITKSRKDIMVLHEMGYPAIAPPSETSLLSEKALAYIRRRSKKQIMLFDYDNTGIHLTWRMRKERGVKKYIFLREGLWQRGLGYKEAKDISDLVDIFDLQTAKEWLYKKCVGM